jgi:hypothetical protein
MASTLSPSVAALSDGLLFLFTAVAALIMSQIEHRGWGEYGLPARFAFRRNFWRHPWCDLCAPWISARWHGDSRRNHHPGHARPRRGFRTGGTWRRIRLPRISSIHANYWLGPLTGGDSAFSPVRACPCGESGREQVWVSLGCLLRRPVLPVLAPHRQSMVGGRISCGVRLFSTASLTAA